MDGIGIKRMRWRFFKILSLMRTVARGISSQSRPVISCDTRMLQIQKNDLAKLVNFEEEHLGNIWEYFGPVSELSSRIPLAVEQRSTRSSIKRDYSIHSTVCLALRVLTQILDSSQPSYYSHLAPLLLHLQR
jgi:hypothetical protein